VDYQEFMQAITVRFPAALNGLRTNLISAGVQANRIVVEPIESEIIQDLRFRITATRGSRTLVAYLEVTSSAIIDNQMAIVITLWFEGNGTQITTTFIPGAPIRFTDNTSIETKLLGKLVNIEQMMTGEILTAARAFLQV
jgi:hypothetical protein